jgi:hypothetical protein
MAERRREMVRDEWRKEEKDDGWSWNGEEARYL